MKLKKGFTLVEMLISILVFVIFLTATSGSYLSLARSIYNANQERKVYSAAQDIINLITLEVKKGVVDYDCYEAEAILKMRIDAGLVNDNAANLSERILFQSPSSVNSGVDMFCANNRLRGDRDLVIRSKDGNSRFIVIFEPQSDGVSGKIKIARQVKTEKLGEWKFGESFDRQNYAEVEVPDNIRIKDLKFKVSPGKNPFRYTDVVKFQFQPQVTVLLEMGASLTGRDDYSLPIQTTISSRVYNKLATL
ncbi:type II secretion system GspH family protein [Patescibacteria group bacterium]|nr:type II secretion system GspH family protein [Patescibacteria group bacterium]